MNTTKATKVQQAFGCRRHTRLQLARAQMRLASMTTDGQEAAKRLAAKYGVTPAQAVANATKAMRQPTGSSGDTCGLRKPTTAEVKDGWKKLAAKYGVTVAQLRSMTAEGLCLMFAEAGCKAAKGVRRGN